MTAQLSHDYASAHTKAAAATARDALGWTVDGLQALPVHSIVVVLEGRDSEPRVYRKIGADAWADSGMFTIATNSLASRRVLRVFDAAEVLE